MSSNTQNQLITLEYINWRGEHKVFQLDSESIYLKGGRLVAKASPKYEKISFGLDNIQNPEVLEPLGIMIDEVMHSPAGMRTLNIYLSGAQSDSDPIPVDMTSLAMKGKKVQARLAPFGGFIGLPWDRIENQWDLVKPLLQRGYQVPHIPRAPDAGEQKKHPRKRNRKAAMKRRLKKLKIRQRKRKRESVPIKFFDEEGNEHVFHARPGTLVLDSNRRTLVAQPVYDEAIPLLANVNHIRNWQSIARMTPAPTVLPQSDIDAIPIHYHDGRSVVQIRYVNRTGKEREFWMDRNSIYCKRDYLVGEVAPSYELITLDIRKIQNAEIVEPLIFPNTKPQTILPRDTQIPGHEEGTEDASSIEKEDSSTETGPAIPSQAPSFQGVSVIITGCGFSTFKANKVLQSIRTDLGAFGIYKLLHLFPKTAVKNITSDRAEEIKQQLEEAGCTVKIE